MESILLDFLELEIMLEFIYFDLVGTIFCYVGLSYYDWWPLHPFFPEFIILIFLWIVLVFGVDLFTKFVLELFFNLLLSKNISFV